MYFKVDIIGSYMLLLDGYIKEHQCNDIDLACDDSNIDGLREYLGDLGYKEDLGQGKQIGYDSERGSAIWKIIHLGIFKKDGAKNIHVVIKDRDYKLLSIPELLSYKLKRGSKNDYLHIAEFASWKHDQRFYTDLANGYDSTRGLHCIDKDPKEVSYDWIKENSFQLEDKA